MHATSIVQLTHSDASFAHLVSDFVGEVRRKLCVPEHADDDVEAEFVALHRRVSGYYPEFCAIYASALSSQLDPERLQEILSGLDSEAAQRYLEAAVQIVRELEQSTPTMMQKLTAAAQTALANPAPSAALSSGQWRALSLARAAGVGGWLKRLAQVATRQALLECGGDSADPQLLARAEAQRIQALLLTMLAGFHARVFIRHVGEPHAAAVVAALERQPLRDYVAAWSAMGPAFARALNELILRITREVL